MSKFPQPREPSFLHRSSWCKRLLAQNQFTSLLAESDSSSAAYNDRYSVGGGGVTVLIVMLGFKRTRRYRVRSACDITIHHQQERTAGQSEIVECQMSSIDEGLKTMKFGLIPVNVGGKNIDQIVTYSQLAESVGIESVWTFEHVIVPEDYASKYPYSADGKMGARPETNFVDPLIALTAIAVNTETLLLGTGVNIVSQANPMYLAKQAASLDFVSGGRFMLGAGIGWLKEEFDAMGVPFERRGARFDDYIVAMRKVWSGEVVEHQSEFINWSGFKSYPVPHRKSGVPIIMGGTKGKIYERVARHGDGWFLPVDNPEALATKMMPLAAACADEGRDPDTIEISCMWNMQGGIDALKAFEDAGASRVILPIFGLGKDPVAGLTEFAETIISKF